MEQLKQMGLKNAFFYLTLLFLLAAVALSIFVFLGLSAIMQSITPNLVIEIGEKIIPLTIENNGYSYPSGWLQILSILQILLPVIFIALALLTADLIFYRVKLKQPLAVLQAGSERIIQNDLDFTIKYSSEDELGQLCTAFETMRCTLLKNNKKLWHQMEERRRLNAAFSHDLRNPVTVLKGSARLLKKGISNGNLSSQNTKDIILLIEEYSGRIEKYIEAMASIQGLEELQCSPKKTDFETLTKALSDSIRLLTMATAHTVQKKFEKHQQSLCIDKSILFNVTENLVANAVRYAKETIIVSLAIEAEEIVLSVQDDGAGFPQSILQKGPQPFLRGEENSEQKVHFGMGLYVCELLCEKHGGSLKLQNTPEGALVTARLRASKP